MMTNYRASQRVFFAIMAVAFLLALPLSAVHADGAITPLFDGDGIWPRHATANSQRWLRFRVTWTATGSNPDIADGVTIDGVTFNDTEAYYDGTSYTYRDELDDGRDGVWSTTAGSLRNYGVVINDSATGMRTITVGPFSAYHYEWLVGRLSTAHTNAGTIYLRFHWQDWVTDHYENRTTTATISHSTVPVAVGTSFVQQYGELQAWHSGEGTGVDPLTVVRSASGGTTDPDNGSGSDEYEFRVKYFSGKNTYPELPPVWRRTDRPSDGFSSGYANFDGFAYQALADGKSPGDSDLPHFRKRTWSDSSWSDWMYSQVEDPHFDHTGDGLAGSGGRNPEAVLIVDRQYDNPYYMTQESGSSLLNGIVYRYIVRPSNLLQMLRNIFTLPFDTAGDDEWDTSYTGVSGYPTANGYVSMRSGGHTYEFLTSRDWDPPVWDIPSTEQNGARQIGKMHVALRGRPGDALEAINFLNQGGFDLAGNYGPTGTRYTQTVRTHIDDDGPGGYGYPSNSQDFAKYPKVDPVLSAHPWFHDVDPSDDTPAGPLTGKAPNPLYNFTNPETGFPMPFQTFMGATIGPDVVGAYPNPFNPYGRDDGGSESYWPWGRVAGPIDSGVTGGYADSITTANASPRRFTNDDTIYPNYVNIYPDTHPLAFQGGKWTTDTNYMFRINYWQSENLAPAYIQLFVRKTDDSGNPLGGGSWMQYTMLKANPSDFEMRDGTVYYFEATGSELGGPGDYQYYFKASDGKGVSIFPNRTSNDPGSLGVAPGNNDYYWLRVNNKPTLSNQTVSPASAPAGSSFTYQITYADLDGEMDPQFVGGEEPRDLGDRPFKSYVHIDYTGDANSVTIDGIAGNVITYTATDSAYEDDELINMQVRLAPDYLLNGPSDPSDGDWTIVDNAKTSATTGTITVASYTGGLAATDEIRIWFTAVMDPTNAGDENYRDGAGFTYNTAQSGVELSAGVHRYYFEFWDDWATWVDWQQYFMDNSTPDPINMKVAGEMVRHPSAGFHEGPEIIQNTAPHLSRYYFEAPVEDRVASGGTPVGSNYIRYQRPSGLPPYTAGTLDGAYVQISSGEAAGYIYQIDTNVDTADPAVGEIRFLAGPWPQNPSSGNPLVDDVAAGNTFRVFTQRIAGADGRYYLSQGYDTPALGDPVAADEYDGTAATPFHIYLTYTDAENNPPSVIKVRLYNAADVAVGTYNMQKVNPGDNVYADGAEYVTNTSVYLAPGSYKIRAQAYDGTEWYGSPTSQAAYGVTPNADAYFGPLTATNDITVAANGPDISVNSEPILDFEVGTGTVASAANSTTTTSAQIVYNETGTGADAVGTDAVVTVEVDTDGVGGFDVEYAVESHDPASNTVVLEAGAAPVTDGVDASDAMRFNVALTPPSGLETDTYTYWVEYTDTDDYAGVHGNPPQYVSVFIDNVEYAMTEYDPADTNMTDGKLFYYSTNALSISENHQYYFMTSDGLDTRRLPSTAPSQYDGPVVHVNTAPVLTDGAVAPTSGSQADSQAYTFTVVYTDADGHAPSEVRVHVLNTSQAGATEQEFAMQRDTSAGGDLSDGGYINGEQFTVTAYAFKSGENQIGDGDHQFYFTADDVHGLSGRDPEATASPNYYTGPKVNDAPIAPNAGFSPASPDYPTANIRENLTVIDDATPTISWTGSDDLDPNATDDASTLNYIVQISTTKDFSAISQTLTSADGDAFVTVPDATPLTNRTDYYYRVRTVDDDGIQSPWSYAGGDPFTAVTAFRVNTNHPPYWDDPALTDFDPRGQVTTLTPTLDWPAGADDDAANPVGSLMYRVEVDESPDFSDPEYQSGLLGPGVTQVAIPAGNLQWGITYYWRVQINDGEFNSLWTNELDPAILPSFSTVENSNPEPPTSGFNPDNGNPVFSAQPTLSWGAGSDPDVGDTPDTLHYELQVDDNNDWSDGNVFEVSTADGVTNAKVTTSLTENTEYWYRVRTIDSQDAASDWSGGHLFWVNTENDDPAAPSSGFNPNNGEETELQRPPLNWNAATDPDNPSPAARQTDTPGSLIYTVQLAAQANIAANGYDYQYSTSVPGQTQLIPGDDLADETTWYWRVRAVDDEGATSAWSLEQYFNVNTNNQPPVLSSGAVSPVMGDLATTFEFSVVYTDAEGDAPIDDIVARIPLAGSTSLDVTLARDPNDTDDYSEGVTFLGTVRGDNAALGLGGYQPYYYIDGTGIRHPAAPDTIFGPVVAAAGEIALDADTYEEGDTVSIEVTDADENQDPAAPDTIQVTVTGDGDSESVTLTETGNDTGVYEGQITMLGAAGSADDGQLNVVAGPAGSQITAVWADPDETPIGVTPATDQATVTDTIAPTAIAAAELSLSSINEGRGALVDWQAYDEAAQPNNQPDVATYHVWQSDAAFTDTADATQIGTVPAGTQTFEVTGLSLGVEYFFAVSVADEVPNEDATVVSKSVLTNDTAAPQVENWQYDAEGGTLAFDLTDASGVDMTTFALSVDGTDVTAGATWDDTDITHVSVDYAAPDGWGYNRQVDFTVDIADIYDNAATYDFQEDAPVDDALPTADQFTPADGDSDAPADTVISARLRDTESGVDRDTVVMTVNGEDVTDELTFPVTTAAVGEAELIVSYQPADPLAYATDYTVNLEFADAVGNNGSAEWTFTTEDEPMFEVRGTVIDENGDPMAGVEVTVNGTTVGTDGNGAYVVSDLSAGDYTVTPSLDDYDFTPASRDITLGPDASDVDFTGALRTYAISGRITRDGSGAEGVTVTDGTRTATTDSDGYYTINDVPSGTYAVTPSRDADGDGMQDFTYTPSSRTITVDGAPVNDVNFTATLVTYTISGTISDSSGNRVAGVSVTDGTRTAITNEAGQFTISDVPPSTVTITPTKTGLAFDPESIEVTVPPNSTGNNFVAYTEFRQRFQAGVHMVGVPATPPSGRDSAVDIFGTDMVARWDAQSTPAGYVFGTDNPAATQLEVRPGVGFFVRFPGVTDVTVPGDPVADTAAFSVGVATGWNQVGNMYQTALPVANISGAGSTQVRPFAFVWDNSIGSYRMISREPAFNSARTYIEAWEAAWFKAVGAPGSLSIQGPANVAAASLLEGAAAQPDAPDNGWLLEVVARVADRADVTSVAGVGSGDDSRGYRVENPPMMPGSVDVYFTDESGARLAHDIRPQSSGAMVWPFSVETDIADAEVEITLPDLSGVPNDMAVYLTDLDSGNRMYARTLPAYTFTTGADGALRHFELEVAPRGADNLTIRTASVQAGNGGLMVTYDLSSAANVSIEVMNIAGRSVRTLIQSRAVQAGSNEQMWDMRSSDGTVVPNGSYLIKIEAVAENGQRVQALRPAQIAR